jgi:hypothetical protein
MSTPGSYRTFCGFSLAKTRENEQAPEKGGMVREMARKEAVESADGEVVASGIYGDREVAGGVPQNTTREYKPVLLTRGQERRQRDNPALATPRSAKPGGSINKG